jgi:hypothetical protein
MKRTVTSPGIPSSPSAPKKRRWWLYALSAFGALLLLAAGSVVVLLGYYTSREPMPITNANVTEADRDALRVKWLQFRQDVVEGRFPAPLRISPEEVNVFFSMLPRYRDRIHLSLVENRMRAEVSMPLEEVLPVLGSGRYVNGVDVFSVRLGADGFPRVEILSAEVNGKRLPRWVERLLGWKELHRDIFYVLDVAPFLGRLKSIEVRDGFVVLTPVNSE